MRYSPERKEAVLRKMMPPHNRTIRELAKEERISEATLYNWRQQAREKGVLMPDLMHVLLSNNRHQEHLRNVLLPFNHLCFLLLQLLKP
jgi:transposase-like protein